MDDCSDSPQEIREISNARVGTLTEDPHISFMLWCFIGSSSRTRTYNPSVRRAGRRAKLERSGFQTTTEVTVELDFKIDKRTK